MSLNKTPNIFQLLILLTSNNLFLQNIIFLKLKLFSTSKSSFPNITTRALNMKPKPVYFVYCILFFIISSRFWNCQPLSPTQVKPQPAVQPKLLLLTIFQLRAEWHCCHWKQPQPANQRRTRSIPFMVYVAARPSLIGRAPHEANQRPQ